MTVSTEWFDELDGDNQETGSIDAYIDVDAGGIQFNTDQISSSTFDGGIPKSEPSNTTVDELKRGDYVFWNLTTGSPVTVSLGSDIDGDVDFTDDYADNLYLVVDIETDDTIADPDSTTATRYIYLQDEEDVKRVSATGSSSVTRIQESDVSEWDAGSEGWLLTSSGNAIFGNVYARGTIFAKSGDIEGNLSFGGSLIGDGWTIDGNSIEGNNSGDVTVKIYANNPQISTNSKIGVINAIGTSFQTAFDANDIQTFSATDNTSPYTPQLLRIQRLGGGLQIGDVGTETDTNIYGDLYVRGSGALAYALRSDGPVRVTGDVNIGTTVVGTGQRLALDGSAYIDGNLTLTGNLTVTGTVSSSNTVDSGYVDAAFSSVASRTVTINYGSPGQYAIISLTPENSSGTDFTIKIGSRDTANGSVTAIVATRGGGTFTGTVRVNWMAIT